jgi:hypothetical protein
MALEPFHPEMALERFNFEKAELICKDLLVNPCRKMLAGELCSPSSKHFKRKML